MVPRWTIVFLFLLLCVVQVSAENFTLSQKIEACTPLNLSASACVNFWDRYENGSLCNNCQREVITTTNTVVQNNTFFYYFNTTTETECVKNSTQDIELLKLQYAHTEKMAEIDKTKPAPEGFITESDCKVQISEAVVASKPQEGASTGFIPSTSEDDWPVYVWVLIVGGGIGAYIYYTKFYKRAPEGQPADVKSMFQELKKGDDGHGWSTTTDTKTRTV